MTDAAGKRGRGRPRIALNMSAILELAAEGFTNLQIQRALSIPSATWARRWREDEFRNTVNITRVSAKASVLAALKREALAGKVGAATMILRRLERRV